ncbi:MAG: transcriptional regulator [Gammaproteobacteria bacterium]|nr:transcriptional regulator [Gammaproteobacteria bacterium]
MRKLLTVITETALEHILIDEIEALGAKGYTITDARGKGSRGTRNAGWETNGNIRLEIVCDDEVANAITTFLQEKYYDNYAMIIFTSDVTVLRQDKFI